MRLFGGSCQYCSAVDAGKISFRSNANSTHSTPTYTTTTINSDRRNHLHDRRPGSPTRPPPPNAADQSQPHTAPTEPVAGPHVNATAAVDRHVGRDHPGDTLRS